MLKLVSVVMSVYNEDKEWLILAIESILNQTYKNLEFIIILDNPQNIELEKVIKNYVRLDDRIIFYKNEINMGLVASLNKAINLSKGEYICRMDADDISFFNRIEKQEEYLRENSDIDLLVAPAVLIDEKGVENGVSCIYKNSIQLMKSLSYKNLVIHPSWMIKSNVLKANNINSYRNIKYAEDYDMLCRLIQSNNKIAQYPETLLYYRVRKSGISMSRFYDQFKAAYCVKKNHKYFLKKGYEKYTLEMIDEIIEKDNWITKYVKNQKINLHNRIIFKLFSVYGFDLMIGNFICKLKYKI